MNTRLLLLVFFLIYFGKQESYSQSDITHEIGITVGPVAFYSDYGQRKDFETNSNNVGLGIGVAHYMNFAYQSRSYFNDHFKIRNEINYHKTNFEHYGEWVRPEKKSVIADQLRAMSGSTTVIEVGTNLEYYPLSIYDFENNGFKLMPYVSFGVHYVHFDPEVSSSLGTLNTSISTPKKYFNAFSQEPGSTFAVLGSVGVRYKLSPSSDLLLDSRWQFYFSDDVDGLNPTFENNKTTKVPENKAKDWIFWLNIGYVFYLN